MPGRYVKEAGDIDDAAYDMVSFMETRSGRLTDRPPKMTARSLQETITLRLRHPISEHPAPTDDAAMQTTATSVQLALHSRISTV